MRRAALLACAVCLGAPNARAAALRAFRIVNGGSVHLSDLFADLAVPDRVLGASPAPGLRITVQAPQLAAIAGDYGVDWRPVTGAEQTILERASTAFAQSAVSALLRPKLTQAGAPADAAISLNNYTPPALATGVPAQADIADFTYDPASFRFTALLTVAAADAPPVVERIAGQVVPMVDAAILTHRLRASAILTSADIQPVRIPASALHGDAPLAPTAVLGLALRRDKPAGQALIAGDLVHPLLVTRNSPVRMQLSAGAITLTAEGVAMEDGALGAHIRVQNPTSHAVMLAEITGQDEVRIVPGHAPIVVAAQ